MSPILVQGIGITKLSQITLDTDKGMFNPYSFSYGRNWTNTGVAATDVIRAMAYLGNGIAILGDVSEHVFRSTDYGVTWTDLGAIVTGGVLSMAYLGNGIAIIGNWISSVYRSTDYGATWTSIGVIGADSISSMAYLGNGIAIMGDENVPAHVFRSTNYGATWTDLGAISPNGGIWSMAYLGNGIAIMGNISGHVYRSTDYGATWTDLGVIADDSIWAMAYLGNGIAILGGEFRRHVYRSTDYGATWTDLGVIATGSVLSMAYLGNGIAIMGDQAGHVYRSTDYGATWTDLGVITGNTIWSMAYLGSGIAIMGGNTNVWRSTSAFGNDNFFNPNQFDKSFQFGCLGIITPNGTSYLAPGNGATQLNEIRVRVPRPGLLKNLFAWQRVASGLAGRTDIYTVRVNGVDTTITCTLNNATAGSDITHSRLVAAGDAVSIKLVSNNAVDTSADVTALVELV